MHVSKISTDPIEKIIESPKCVRHKIRFIINNMCDSDLHIMVNIVFLSLQITAVLIVFEENSLQSFRLTFIYIYNF